MPANSVLTDPLNGRVARVVRGNALAVAASHPSQAFNGTLDTDDTPVNIVFAQPNRVFCITGIVLVGNKNINTNVDATVNIYTAASAATALSAATTILFTLPVARSGSLIITPILLETGEAEYINAETTDDDVLVTILGYYLELDIDGS